MSPTRPPVSGGRWKAIGLAVAVHLLLAAFLIVGIRWKTSAPPPLEAELFTPPQTPVAKPEPPPPEPPAPKQPAPKPVPQPDVAKPDIVTEKTRLAAAEAERQRFAEARKETERRIEEKKRAEEEARRKAEELKVRKAREAAEERRKAAEQAKKEAAAKARKEAEERARKEAEEKAAKAAEEQRTAYLKGLMDKASGSASGSGVPSPAGTPGAGGAGGDNSYRSLLSSRIRAGTIFSIPPELSGNPKAVFLVTVMPDCTIAAVKLQRSSGVPSWDEAAARGIQRASPLPRMRDGTCPQELEITRGPRDSD